MIPISTKVNPGLVLLAFIESSVRAFLSARSKSILKKIQSELDLYGWLTKFGQGPGVKVGIGHDAAVLAQGKGDLVLKVDQLVETIHFLPTTPNSQIAHKALSRPLSDLAAIGARPHFALAAISTPKKFPAKTLRKLLHFLDLEAKKYRLSLVGGDLCMSQNRLNIGISLAGFMEHRKPSLRSAAKPGQRILVTGELGGSILGKHLRFEPRLREGLHLARHYAVGGMIDISDGLSLDLARVCESSRVGARVFSKQIPVSKAAKALSKKSGKPALTHALSDGEDYELLFTLSPKEAEHALKDPVFRQSKIHVIGEVLKTRKLWLEDSQGKNRPLPISGYVHNFS